MSVEIALPAGLEVHCEACQVVVPSDAPKLEGADCEFVARHKLAWFNPKESPAGQHCMAAAAWELIHDAPLRAGHPDAVAYLRAFQRDRKNHFAQSALRQAMTPEQVQAGLLHRRDGVLYR